MPKRQLIVELIPSLMEAKTFEEAARATLSAMLRCVETEVAPQGRLLRGVVHVRPEDSYRRLFGIEHPSGERVDGTGYLTSANIWRWVSEQRAAASIDVRAGTVRTWRGEGASDPDELRGASGLPGSDTRNRMIERETTHVHVVPLRAPTDGSVTGMISLEASCPGERDPSRIWGASQPLLDMIAAVAASYLSGLPSQRAPEPKPDSLMPVIGPQTGGTGGTLGSRYLLRTIDQKFFPKLWEVRSRFFGQR